MTCGIQEPSEKSVASYALSKKNRSLRVRGYESLARVSAVIDGRFRMRAWAYFLNFCHERGNLVKGIFIRYLTANDVCQGVCIPRNASLFNTAPDFAIV